MKKIITLFAVATVALATIAGDCPTQSMLYLLNGDDAANVEIELGFSKNTSACLEGFAFAITKPEGASWKKAYGNDFFTAQGYAPYILGCLTNNNGEGYSEEELEGFLNSRCDILSNLNGDKLVIIEILNSYNCRFFPAYPGKVGKFTLDMSALEDGEYEIFTDNNADNSNLFYKPYDPNDNQQVWNLSQPMVITLLKEGNTVIEKGRVPATFAPEYSDISTVVADKADSRIFDFQGRELKSVPEHGVYIQKGKKYVK